VQKTEELLELVDRRTQWVEILAEIRKTLPDGMWLNSIVVKEEDKPGRSQARNTRRAPVQSMDQAQDEPEGMTKVEIAGFGYLDKVQSARPIREFRDKLRASEYFSDETEITWQPAPARDDYAREFKILVVLEKPLIP
jgi:Tfp pilus assembly protein PilN